MQYSNDEADKRERQKDFVTTVYIWPALITAVLCGLFLFSFEHGYITKTDCIYGCVLSLTPATFFSAFKRRNWLKMPDGTHHNIKAVAPQTKLSLNEPTGYLAEYFYSRNDKATSAICGLIMLAAGIWLSQKSSKSILIPISTMLGGMFLSYVGFKGLLDKTAKLKIAKTGLWTNKLGFINWDAINYAEVVENKKGDTSQMYLEIRLKGTKFEEAKQPDERLLLTDLKNKGDIEMVISNAIFNYNREKKQQTI